MMRLSVLAPYFVPAVKAGGPVPGIIGALASVRGQEIVVHTSDRDLGDTAPYPDPHRGEYRIGESTVNYLPPLSRSTLSAWHRAVRQFLAADAIYLNSLFAKQFTIAPVLVMAVARYRGIVLISPRGELAASALALGGTRQKRLWLRLLRSLRLFRSIGRRDNATWLASSEHERSDILRQFPAAHVVISPEVVRSPSHDDLDALRQAPQGTLRLISVSRIAPVKGVIDLVRALSLVRVPVHLTLVGGIEDAAYARQVEEEARAFPTGVEITWKGVLTASEIDIQLRAAHAFVSLSHGENFGHSIGEALQAGCPVILSDQTPWSWVADEGAGIVLTDEQCRRPEDVAGAVEKIAALPADQWALLSARARDCGRRGVLIEGSVTLWEAIQQGLAERSAGQAARPSSTPRSSSSH